MGKITDDLLTDAAAAIWEDAPAVEPDLSAVSGAVKGAAQVVGQVVRGLGADRAVVASSVEVPGVLKVIQSGVREVARLPVISQQMIRDEPSFSVIRTEDAAALGGPIHQAVVAALPPGARQGTLLSSTVVWVKKGWAAGTRGLRVDQYEVNGDGDTDHRKPRFPGQDFYMYCAGVSRTRFVTGEIPLPDYPPGARTSHLFRQLVEDLEVEGRVTSALLADHTLYAYDNQSVHETSPALRTGWCIIVRVFPMRRVRLEWEPKALRAVRVVLNQPALTTASEAILARGVR